MKLKELESFIMRVHETRFNILHGKINAPLYEYYHQGDEFTYKHISNSTVNFHQFLKGKIVPVFWYDTSIGFLSYDVEDQITRHEIFISEELHFQLSTIQPVLSLDCLEKIHEIIHIL